jgi:uncharacterized protein (TIGR02996 family)
VDEAEPLLAAVLAAPEDDAPRLVFADWLSERGDPRGELILVQCQLAKQPAHGRGRAELMARESVLLAKHGDEWRASMASLADEVVLRRGFIDELWFRDEDCIGRFVTAAPHVFGHVPVRVIVLAPAASQTVPDAEGWYEEIPPAFAAADLRALASVRDLARLRVIDLSRGHVDATGAAVLAAARGLTGPRLHVSCSKLGDEGAQALADSPHLTALSLHDPGALTESALGALRTRFGAGLTYGR